ncbi:hypothetical protein GALMADRAFT_270753 [Galerina marginata CBS 339.88]|uniref:Uncharacterized protein n=1 Tax=Galerina marginata (strain CBS 339.88) TaxID=685588 RepID=A0A067SQG0_GALM3|nr:hypothetical protein GALMADRAFT_270753 [Galerina marginata CBS 339.88]
MLHPSSGKRPSSLLLDSFKEFKTQNFHPFESPENSYRLTSATDCHLMSVENVSQARQLWIKGREITVACFSATDTRTRKRWHARHFRCLGICFMQLQAIGTVLAHGKETTVEKSEYERRWSGVGV